MPDTENQATVRVERDGGVAVVVIDRPRQKNALDAATKVALRDALQELGDDDAVRAVVLTGNGGAFCVGQDLGEHAAHLAAEPARAFATVEEHYNPIVRAMTSMPKPVIAAVEGPCFGAGLGLALAADLRVMADDAKLGTAFTGIGLTCDSGLSATLARSVGVARAKELVLLAAPFTAQEAVAWGIASAVVPAGEVQTTARTMAARLAAGPTLAYAAAKHGIDAAATLSLDAALDAEGVAQSALGRSDDHQGAVKAFLAKERPVFAGR